MNNNNANFTPAAPNFRTLVRMSFQGLTNFPYIEEDFDALTNYELLSKVVEYLNQVISNNNEQNTLMTNLYNAYVSLQDYVNDYFDNLDVQDEINNKLDDMAQSGELTLLIKNYVDPIYQAYESRINNEVLEQNQEISDFKTIVNSSLNGFDTRLSAVASGSPLVASSTSGMTNTNRVYVNTTDGKWYYYDGDSWEIGGTYQSTGIGENTVGFKNLTTNLQDVIEYKVPTSTTLNGKYVYYDTGAVADLASYNIADNIHLKKGYTILVNCKATTTVAIFAEKLENGYASLAAGESNSENLFYSYTAPKDMNISVSYDNRVSFTVETYLKEKELLDITDELETEIENTNQRIDDLQNLTYPEYTETSGDYVTYPSGVIGHVYSYSMTSPILVQKNKTIYLKGVCTTNVAVFSEVNNGTYTALLPGLSSTEEKEYKYVAPKDMYICCCFDNRKNIEIKIYNDITNVYNVYDDISYLKNKRENILTMYSNISCYGDSLTYCQVYTSSNTSRQAHKTWPTIVGIKTGAEITALATPGYTSSNWWNNYNSQITEKTNQLTIIYLGHNQGLTDTVATDCAGDDPTQFANTNTGNYGRIIAKCLSVGSKVILLKCWASTGNLTDTNKAIEDLATKFNVAWVKNEKLTDNIYHYYPDKSGTNSHYNDLGYTVFSEKLIENISNMPDEMIERIYPE